MTDPLQNWFWSDVTVGIAAHLLAADPDSPRRVDEIATELERNDRVIRGLLDRLHAGRLVARTKLVTGEAGRPAWVYWLSDEQRVIAERAVETPPSLWPRRESHSAIAALDPTEVAPTPDSNDEDAFAPSQQEASDAGPGRDQSQRGIGHLHRGQELVVVDISGSAFASLLEALSSVGTASLGMWVTRLGDELVFVFDGQEPVAPASELLSLLAGARLSVRQTGVAQVMRAEDLADQAKRISPAIRRARMTRDAHDAPQ